MEVELNDTDRCVVDVEKHYFQPGGIFEVLVDANGRVVGSYGLMPHGDDCCELRKMYLYKEYRGKGLGRYMLERALAEARRLGFRRVELETASVLKEAVGLYRAYGFQPIERAGIPARCDGAMGLTL